MVPKHIEYDTGDVVAFDEAADVIDFGSDLFMSEDIVDKAYEVYLAMLAKQFSIENSAGVKIADFGVAYTDGLYLCGVRRAVLTHQYDPVNDIVPNAFSVWVGDNCVEVFREIPKVPREWRTAAQGRHFKNTLLAFVPDKPATVTGNIITLMADGRIIPAAPAVHGQNGTTGPRAGMITTMASVAINLFCDRRYLWQVETAEHIIGRAGTPLSIGVSPDHIKSLFYARSLPVTESGRKRPILHWVRAHQRRLAAGIDVDISKHLRGVDAFEMGGFDWSITNPLKGVSV